MAAKKNKNKKRKVNDTSNVSSTDLENSESATSPGKEKEMEVSQNAVLEKLDNIERKIDGNKTALSKKIECEVERLRSEIFELQRVNDCLTEKLQQTEKKCTVLHEEVECLRKCLDVEREKRNDLDQYGRREMLRFVKLGPDSSKETAQECETKVLHLINNKLGLTHINYPDISVAHRVGQYSAGYHRQVIVKFVSRRHRNEVIQARRKLKGSKIAVIEDLTPLNAERLGKVRKHRSVVNTWTKEGRIFALLTTDRVVRVERGDMTEINLAPPKDNGSPGNNEHSSSQNFRRTGHSGQNPRSRTAPFPPPSRQTAHVNYSRAGASPDFSRPGTSNDRRFAAPVTHTHPFNDTRRDSPTSHHPGSRDERRGAVLGSLLHGPCVNESEGATSVTAQGGVRDDGRGGTAGPVSSTPVTQALQVVATPSVGEKAEFGEAETVTTPL
ncbi:uncharacterized protein [Littorina saxatilis]|uniref:uncharacterized protein n=1 Tax=Littorina saxatilis TaxID=31220 RepID=UPI0038B531A2